jgi:hypothetical protein
MDRPAAAGRPQNFSWFQKNARPHQFSPGLPFYSLSTCSKYPASGTELRTTLFLHNIYSIARYLLYYNFVLFHINKLETVQFAPGAQVGLGELGYSNAFEVRSRQLRVGSAALPKR